MQHVTRTRSKSGSVVHKKTHSPAEYKVEIHVLDKKMTHTFCTYFVAAVKTYNYFQLHFVFNLYKHIMFINILINMIVNIKCFCLISELLHM